MRSQPKARTCYYPKHIIFEVRWGGKRDAFDIFCTCGATEYIGSWQLTASEGWCPEQWALTILGIQYMAEGVERGIRVAQGDIAPAHLDYAETCPPDLREVIIKCQDSMFNGKTMRSINYWNKKRARIFEQYGITSEHDQSVIANIVLVNNYIYRK